MAIFFRKITSALILSNSNYATFGFEDQKR